MLVPPPTSTDELDLPRVYIERLVLVPPEDAEVAFDLLVGEQLQSVTEEIRFKTGAGDLVLRGPVRTPTQLRASAVYPIRVVDGWLTSRTGLYRMHVEAELLRWSRRSSALGLRPKANRHHPLGFGPYFRIGGEALNHLRDEMEDLDRSWAGTRCA